jgi:hypothetical protein
METEGSLPCPQEPATCPYPEPDQSSPRPPPSYFLKIHFNIILPFTPRFSKWSFSFRFPDQNPVYPPPLLHTRHMHRPSHLCLNNTVLHHKTDVILFTESYISLMKQQFVVTHTIRQTEIPA